MTERAEHFPEVRDWLNGGPLNADVDRAVPFSSPLPAQTLNIEAKSRSNLFPWRGQFSPELVEALLRAYAAPGSSVLDPFMGSGTVLVESARLGLPVSGREVNPAAYLLGRVYELCELDAAERAALVESAEEVLVRACPTAFDPPLFRTRADSDSPRTSVACLLATTSDPAVRILLEALVVVLDAEGLCADTLARKWSTIREIVASLPFTKKPVRCSLGDARSLPIPDATVDFVLSSPPYINVFNYHHNLRAGIESLGWRPLVIARSEIGSNRKFRQNRFLTVVQYCMDMALALAELRRVCTGTARVLLILGRESNVHKTAFYNGRIVEDLATKIAGLRMHLKQERVFVNRFGQTIYEDILHLSPSQDGANRTDAIIEGARDVGKAVLLRAVERAPSDRVDYLRDAVRRVAEIAPSPVLQPAAARGDLP
jgi:hypothetical protein